MESLFPFSYPFMLITGKKTTNTQLSKKKKPAIISDMGAETKHSWIMILIMSQNHTEGLLREFSLLVRNRTVVIIDQFSISMLFSPCYQHLQSKVDVGQQ